MITGISCLCSHITQCNVTVWEQNQGTAQEPPLSAARTPQSCPLQAAAARSCSSCMRLTQQRGQEQLHSSCTCPSTPSPESSCLHPLCHPRAEHTCTTSGQCSDMHTIFTSFLLFGFFVCLLGFFLFFPQRRDSRHCSALGDEKQLVVAPYSKLHF